MSRWAPVGLLALAVLIRVAHLSYAMVSPLTWQPGPDEDYYRRFGEAVAAGHGALSPEFTFMDPAYGYILGAIFKLFGPNLFVVYLVQALLDTLTVYGIMRIGRLLDKPRAGLFGAALYCFTATAVMFCSTLLKEVWVTAWLTWWVVGALTLIRSGRNREWVLFGIYCGLGVGLRSTLLVPCVFTALLPLWRTRGEGTGRWRAAAALTVCGMVIGLAPWSLRNHYAGGSLSPLPHNGGIVLHQIYNVSNPEAEIWIPAFVSYLEPSEIWRGYATEATRVAGHSLTPSEVDRYWRNEALSFMVRHPAEILADVGRKGLGWISNSEVANNRSSAEERMFSPVLSWLPSPAAWLLGMGLVGLVGFALDDRRWAILALPVALSWLTTAVFFAESRFRFHCASILALCSGIWIEQLALRPRGLSKQRAATFAGAAVLIVLTSVWLGTRTPPVRVAWDRIAWGYIKMGRIAQAEAIAEKVSREQPDNGPIFEALGYIAVVQKHYDEAAQAFQRAVEIRPRSHVAHYNLARVYMALGDRKRAVQEAAVATHLYPSPDYEALLSRLNSGS